MMTPNRASRYSLLVLPLLAIACDSSVDPSPEDADVQDGGDGAVSGGDLRLITWNLENFPAASNTVGRVAELVDELDVDLVGVQEIVSISAFTELVLSLPEHDGVFANDPSADIVVGLLFRDSRVRVVSYDTLFRDDWYAFPRPPLMARVEVLDLEGEVESDAIVMVVHLKAQLDDESRERRLAACEQLEEWISESDESQIIVMGDWNDEITDEPTDNIFQPFLDQPSRYSFLTMELAESGGFTYLPFESFLDHFLVTAGILEEFGQVSTSILELETSVPNYEVTISDHRPVLVELEF